MGRERRSAHISGVLPQWRVQIRGVFGLFAMLLVVVGVVTMHSMSATATSHHAVTVTQDHVATAHRVSAMEGDGSVSSILQFEHTITNGSVAEFGQHLVESAMSNSAGAVMAMCFAVFVLVLLLVVPRRWILAAAPQQQMLGLPAWRRSSNRLSQTLAPSLTALGISRT